MSNFKNLIKNLENGITKGADIKHTLSLLKLQVGRDGNSAVDVLQQLARDRYRYRQEGVQMWELARQEEPHQVGTVSRMLRYAARMRLQVDVDRLMKTHSHLKKLESIKADDLFNIAWALVFLHANTEISKQWLVKATRPLHYPQDPSVVSNLLWAAATLKVHSHHLVYHVKKRILVQNDIRFIDYSRLTWGLTVLREFSTELQERSFRNTSVVPSAGPLLKALWVCKQVRHTAHGQLLTDSFEVLSPTITRDELLQLLALLPPLRTVTLGPSIQARVNKELQRTPKPLDPFMLQAMHSLASVGAGADYEHLRSLVTRQLRAKAVASLSHESVAFIIKTFGLTNHLDAPLVSSLLPYVTSAPAAVIIDTAWLLLEYDKGAFASETRMLIEKALLCDMTDADRLLLLKTMKKSGQVYPGRAYTNLLQQFNVGADPALSIRVFKSIQSFSDACELMMGKIAPHLKSINLKPSDVAVLYTTCAAKNLAIPPALHAAAARLPAGTPQEVIISIFRSLLRLSPQRGYPEALCAHLASLVAPNALNTPQRSLIMKLANDPALKLSVRDMLRHAGSFRAPKQQKGTSTPPPTPPTPTPQVRRNHEPAPAQLPWHI